MAHELVATAPHVLAVRDFTPGPMLPGQVRVETEYASGKHGTALAIFDALNFQGQNFDQTMRMFVPAVSDGVSAATGPSSGEYAQPMRLGTTAVGRVVEVGADVKADFSVGDRVVGLMKVASENVVEADRVWQLGDADPIQALCIEPAYVSFHAVREANIRFGDTVAVIGLGAIGLIAVEMAYRAGASRVIAVDPLPNRRAWAEAHGAVEAIDPAKVDAPLGIHELTDGLGADVTIEASGSYRALEAAIKATRMRGTVCAAGFYQGEATGLWLGREFHHNRLTVVVPHGCGWGHEPRDFPRWDEHRAYTTIVEILRGRRIDLHGIIDPIVSIGDMPDVWRRIETAPETVIKYGVKF
ncbi:MAG: hypothetical protein EA426_01440 [Spirochaetaceae bacterium]|nr:MAG: hypothetical protein EA426_01440 [Spirochaetaceae bacterium]